MAGSKLQLINTWTKMVGYDEYGDIRGHFTILRNNPYGSQKKAYKNILKDNGSIRISITHINRSN